MLCRYVIELCRNVPGILRNVIPREELENWKQAQQLLRHANDQAAELLSLTAKQCESLREEAALDVWRRADAQLKRWENERQAMCDKLEDYANAITCEAIRCLLDETAPPVRLSALLKKLLENQVQEVSSTLLCHPHDFDEIKQCLASHKTTAWKLHADDSIPSQTLVLKTDEGDFHISWNSMLDALFSHSKAFQSKV